MLSLMFLCFIIPGVATAQDSYHVVVGAFAIENNARKFTGYVRSKFYNAQYDQKTSNKLYYVYVLRTSQRASAYQQAKLLQKESEFKDAWVYFGVLESSLDIVVEQYLPTLVDTTETSEPLLAETDTMAVAYDTVSVTEDTTLTAPVERKAKGKFFKFVIQTQTGQPVLGEVHQVDYTRGRDIATYRAGQLIDVLPPPRANNPMTMVCGVFGYKEVIRLIDYTNPAAAGATQDENGAWVITYPLEPLNTGDVSVMYRVSFIKDAVVMLPNSKFELDQLVNMMNSNPNYRIKIHGHCNGNHSRRIIAMGTTRNYFDINGSREIKGSAKELSKQRAEAVQLYLIEHGIEKNRTQIYAWAGNNMLVDENSTSAKLNDRIEIEIIKN